MAQSGGLETGIEFEQIEELKTYRDRNRESSYFTSGADNKVLQVS